MKETRFVILTWTIFLLQNAARNVELVDDTGVNYSEAQRALSHTRHLSVVSERRRSALWILNPRRERGFQTWLVWGIKKENRQGKYPQCFEVTLRLVVRHLRVGQLPSPKLASNLLGPRVGPPGIQGVTGCLSGIAYAPPLPLLSFSLSQSKPPLPHTRIHTTPTRLLSHCTLAISIAGSKEIWNCLWSWSLGN